MKNLKKYIALALASTSAFALVGCNFSQGAKEERDMNTNVASTLVDYGKYSEEKQVSVSAWRGPTDLSDEQWTLFKESGINTLIVDSTQDGKMGSKFGASNQRAYIEKCAEYGLNAIGFTVGVLDTNITDYSNESFYDSIAGIDYTDEPSISEFEDIASVINDFSSKYFGKKLFVCMLSSGSGALHWGTTDYREYLNTWYDTVLSALPDGMPRVLATDVYPLMDNNNKRGTYYTDETWLASLAYLGEQKLAHPELTLHMAMQSMSFGLPQNTTPRRLPDTTDCRFQAYVNMTFGVTEFSWFTYSTPPMDEREFSEEHVAMIDRDGKPTQSYYAVQAVNQELASLDELFLSLDWHGVYPVQSENSRDKLAYQYLRKIDKVLLDIEDMNTVKKISSDRNALVGQFTDENDNEVFSLVNYGDPKENISSTVTLELASCDKIIVYRNGVPTTENVTDGVWSITLAPGEGVYVIPYKA